MAFDPDAYLANSTSSSSFDPDAYLGQSSPSSPPQQGVLGAVGAALASRPELQAYGAAEPNHPSSSVAGSALQAAGQTLEAPIRTGVTLSRAPEVTGQAASDIGLATGYPKTGAAIGTAISMAPYVAGGVGIYKGLNAVENPIVKGLMNTPQELGPQYQILDEQAGVSDKLPIQKGTVAKFPGLDGMPQNQPPTQAPNIAPLSYPKDRNLYLNFVRDRIDGVGQKLTPQELADHDKILDDIMSGMKAKGQGGTPVFQKAAQAGSDITDLRNVNVSGRADLNKAYGISKGQQGISDAAKHYGTKAIQWGGPVAAGLSGLYGYLKK